MTIRDRRSQSGFGNTRSAADPSRSFDAAHRCTERVGVDGYGDSRHILRKSQRCIIAQKARRAKATPSGDFMVEERAEKGELETSVVRTVSKECAEEDGGQSKQTYSIDTSYFNFGLRNGNCSWNGQHRVPCE